MNKKTLKDVYNYVYSENYIDTIMKDSKVGDKTLIIKGNKEVYFHSKYNPKNELKKLMDEKEIDGEKFILFYGTGLGYHIEDILSKYPNINYYIYEPIGELFNRFISNSGINFKNTNLRGMVVGKESYGESLDRFLDIGINNLEIIELPTHKSIYKDEFKEFMEIIKESFSNKKNILRVSRGFQENWTLNSMKNFKYVLKSENILMNSSEVFRGKRAFLVSAGPSLNYEIDNLKYIKENNLGFIFSVGSAINTLVNKNIYPDYTVSYDPKQTNHGVVKIIKDKNIEDIPLIFGSSVGYKTIEAYPGRLYSLITSQDSVSSYFLKSENCKEVDFIGDAPTVALVTLQLLSKLGFSEIVLIGQNLAYVGNKNHSDGISYSKQISDEELKSAIKIKDVNGNDIYTNESYNQMKHQMEEYILGLDKIKVYNTTIGGAMIEGTEFKLLDDLIEKIQGGVNHKPEYTVAKYDKKYLDFKYRKMGREFRESFSIINEYKEVLSKIDRDLNNMEFVKIEKLYVRLNKELKRVEKNDFFKSIIIPMKRVEYTLLIDSIDSMNSILDPMKKAKLIHESFNNFLDTLLEGIKNIEFVYKDMMADIKLYLEEEDE